MVKLVDYMVKLLYQMAKHPCNPEHTMRQLAEDLYVVEHDTFTFGIHFPGRMIVVRIGDAVALISPVPIDDALAARIDALGDVRWIASPNMFHHLYVGPAAERYPGARVLAPRGLRKKRTDLTIDATWDEGPPTEWDGVLAIRTWDGMPAVQEVVFGHLPSNTVIVTDLVMNVHSCRGLASRLVYWLEGCWRRPGAPRLNRLLTKDRDAARASRDDVLSWAPERLVMAHGDIIESGAADVFDAAFAWLGDRRALPAAA